MKKRNSIAIGHQPSHDNDNQMCHHNKQVKHYTVTVSNCRIGFGKRKDG